jgi:hypothetical protein
MGNIHGQRLNVDIAERRGSGFVGRHGPDFLNFHDSWSQTINQLYDQDGSMYIIDWYDKNQCHHNEFDGHDRSNGRIYKVVLGRRRSARWICAGSRMSTLSSCSSIATNGIRAMPNGSCRNGRMRAGSDDEARQTPGRVVGVAGVNAARPESICVE